jgi:transposase InsO family protein
LSVVELCQLAGVSRASFYRSRQPDSDDEEECALRDQVERIALDWPAYGSRRIAAQLRRQGRNVNRKRVQRILRENGLLCLRQPSAWVRTTQSKHTLPVFPNLAQGLRLERINQLWVADITYVRLRQEFVFLAGILDAFSRRVIGWALDRTLEASLCIAALERALRVRQPEAGLIHHSDRGVQYCSKEYVALLDRHAIRGSMARTGNPFDNARAETFWKTLKYEQVYRYEYGSLAEARASIAHFIERVYNSRRLHSALGYRPPIEFEAAIVAAAPSPA